MYQEINNSDKSIKTTRVYSNDPSIIIRSSIAHSTKPTNTAYAFMRLSPGYYKITKDLLERDPEVLQALAKHFSSFKIDSKLLTQAYASLYKNVFYFLSLGRHLGDKKLMIGESKELTPIVGEEPLNNVAMIANKYDGVFNYLKQNDKNEKCLQIINSVFCNGSLGEMQITFDEFLPLFTTVFADEGNYRYNRSNSFFLFEILLHTVKNIQVTGHFILLKQIENKMHECTGANEQTINNAYMLATLVEQIGAQLTKQGPKDLKMACLRLMVQLLEKFHWGFKDSLLTKNDSFFNLGIRFLVLLSEGSCELPACTVKLIYDLEKLIKEKNLNSIEKFKGIKDRLLNLDNILAIKDNPMKLHFLEQKIADESFVPNFEIIFKLTGSTDMQLLLLQKMLNQPKLLLDSKEVLGFLQNLSKDPSLFVNNVNACTKLIEQFFLKMNKLAGTQEKIQAVKSLKAFYEEMQKKLPRNSNSNNYKMITDGGWKGVAVQLDITIADVETLSTREKIVKAFWALVQYLKDSIPSTSNNTVQCIVAGCLVALLGLLAMVLKSER